MEILQTIIFYSACWLFTWAFITLCDRRRANSPNLTYSERLALAEECIPVWGWFAGLAFFLILFVLVPFVGFTADLK